VKPQTRAPDAAADASGARPRPRIHFTADDGWINDPYGTVWFGDRYHLFYQALPGRVTWAPECTWGHATSPDLVRWSEGAPALTPQPFELGCWSGSVVPDQSALRLFYTRIAGKDLARGAVATAAADGDGWTSVPGDVLIAGPPAELGVHTFRDPYVFRHGDEWVMIVGAGLRDGSGAAVHYRSSDLHRWTCDGVLASRPNTPTEEVRTGAVWECPQLFPLDEAWVLLVSVWDDDVLYYVSAAIGDYDGRRFTARRWQRLTWGSSAYAASAFLDRDGRRCVLTWLREEPQNNPLLTERAGAHSLPAVLTLDGDGAVRLCPHPDVYRSARPVPASALIDGYSWLSCEGNAVQLLAITEAGLEMRVCEGDLVLAALEVDAGGTLLRVRRPIGGDQLMPVAVGAELRVVLDADIVEIFSAAGYGAFRIGVPRRPEDVRLGVAAPHPAAFSLL
jgi:beta-fructofuranosidase